MIRATASRKDWPSDDVHWFLHKKNLKRPVAYSTVATSRLLGLLHEDNPSATIAEIRDMILFDADAVRVCDRYISLGEGDVVPDWSY